tara:strand:- start:299 stop:571 length:273 start_codon:yes stop_codon:yes gene_type:complete
MKKQTMQFLKIHIIIMVLAIALYLVAIGDPFSTSFLDSLKVIFIQYLILLVPDMFAGTFFLIEWIVLIISVGLMTLPFTALIFWLKHRKS